MDIPLPPMNPEVARLRRQAAHRKYIKRLRAVRMLWAFAGALLVALLVEVLLALCFSPRFWVFRLAVTGGDTLTTPEIIRLAAIPPESNYYRVSLRKTAERVRAGEPRVREVTVRRGDMGTLAVHVDERVPLCRLGGVEPPRYLDEERVLFTRPTAPVPVPVVEGIALSARDTTFGKAVSVPQVRAVVQCLLAVRETFPSDAPLVVERVHFDEHNRVTLTLPADTKVLLGDARHFDEKMWVVRNTIAFASTQGYALGDLEYIDARVFARAAGLGAGYKPKSNVEATRQ